MNKTQFHEGQIEMCKLIKRMIEVNRCDEINILGWCNAFISAHEPDLKREAGYNPWQE